MSSKRHVCQQQQRGQALLEFLVIAAALVPLFLMLPMIAKYQDIAHSTLIASRYAAFDDMVRNAAQNKQKPIEQLQDEVRRRFFSHSVVPIKTNDVSSNFKADQNLFWRGPRDQALIADINDVTVSKAQQKSKDAVGFLHEFGGTGMTTTRVNVRLANLPNDLAFYKPLDAINLVMERSTSVVTDGWSAKNPADADGKVAEITPNVEVLSVLSTVIDPFMTVVEPGVGRPKLGRLEFWRDDVPADRLKK